jgi:hypothetical protein
MAKLIKLTRSELIKLENVKFLHKQVQVFQTFWRKILAFFEEVVGTRHERDNGINCKY